MGPLGGGCFDYTLLHALRRHLHVARFGRRKPNPPDEQEDDSLDRKNDEDVTCKAVWTLRRDRGGSLVAFFWI